MNETEIELPVTDIVPTIPANAGKDGTADGRNAAETPRKLDAAYAERYSRSRRCWGHFWSAV